MRVGYEVGKRYRIIRSLGEGGMANVYEAEDLVQKRRVTLKMLRFDLQDDPRSVGQATNSISKIPSWAPTRWDVAETPNRFRKLVFGKPLLGKSRPCHWWRWWT